VIEMTIKTHIIEPDYLGGMSGYHFCGKAVTDRLPDTWPPLSLSEIDRLGEDGWNRYCAYCLDINQRYWHSKVRRGDVEETVDLLYG